MPPLRFALLAILPLLAVSEGSNMGEYLEALYKPCIVYKRNCPSDGSMDLDKYESVVRNLIKAKPPRECDCEPSSESCVRKCYYAYVSSMYLNSALADKSDPEDILKARETTINYLKPYRNCILNGVGCSEMNLTYEQFESAVINYLKTSRLPKECNCNPDKEQCIRNCYYSYLAMTMNING